MLGHGMLGHDMIGHQMVPPALQSKGVTGASVSWWGHGTKGWEAASVEDNPRLGFWRRWGI